MAVVALQPIYRSDEVGEQGGLKAGFGSDGLVKRSTLTSFCPLEISRSGSGDQDMHKMPDFL